MAENQGGGSTEETVKKIVEDINKKEPTTIVGQTLKPKPKTN